MPVPWRGPQTRSYRLNDDPGKAPLDVETRTPLVFATAGFSRMHAAAPKKQGSGEGRIVTVHWIHVWEHVLPSGPVEPLMETHIL